MISAAQLADHRAKLEAREIAARGALASVEGIVDYQVTLEPHLERRPDLQGIADIFEAAEAAARGNGQRVLGLISTGAQVGKTKMIQAGYAWWLRRNPSHFLGYGTYQSVLAERKSEQIRDLALKAGVELRTGSNAKGLWTTPAGGGLLASGIQSGWTGQDGLKCGVIDDPYADMLQAMSVAENARVMSSVESTIGTRLHPTTSMIVCHTPWTQDDVIARLRKKIAESPELRASFRVMDVKLAVVDDFTGEALITWGGRTKEYWAGQRAIVGEQNWWAMYMCDPRDDKRQVFDMTRVVRGPRPTRYRCCIGTDMAYSTATSSDWSVAVVLLLDLDNYVEIAGMRFPLLYVDDVIAKQCSSPEWFEVLKALKAAYGGARVKTRTGGQEIGIVDNARAQGLEIHHEPSRFDKLITAQAAAATHARGCLVFPEDPRPWFPPMTMQMRGFTGRAGGKDDYVDALLNGHDDLCTADLIESMNSNGQNTQRVQGYMSQSVSLGRMM